MNIEQPKNTEEKSLRRASPLIVDLSELKIVDFIYFLFYFILFSILFSIFELRVRDYYDITNYHMTML